MANKQIKHLMLKLLGQDTEEVMDIYDEKAVHIANDVTKADISKDVNSNNYKYPHRDSKYDIQGFDTSR